MKILFDDNTPAPLARFLRGHEVVRADELGWQGLENGALLDAAGQAGFDLLLTCDQNGRYQQNFASRKLALVILSSIPGRPCGELQRESPQPSISCRPGTSSGSMSRCCRPLALTGRRRSARKVWGQTSQIDRRSSGTAPRVPGRSRVRGPVRPGFSFFVGKGVRLQ